MVADPCRVVKIIVLTAQKRPVIAINVALAFWFDIPNPGPRQAMGVLGTLR